MKVDATINLNTLLILGAAIFLYYFLHTPPIKPPEPKVTIVNHYDSIQHEVSQVVIRPVINIPQQIPIILSRGDSEQIIKDYYTKKFDQRIFSDSNVEITSSDTLFQNAKLFSGLSYKWKRPVFVEKTIELQPVPVNKVFIGAFTSINPTRLGLGPEIVIMNKREQMFRLGKDFLSNTWYGSMDFKISFKK